MKIRYNKPRKGHKRRNPIKQKIAREDMIRDFINTEGGKDLVVSNVLLAIVKALGVRDFVFDCSTKGSIEVVRSEKDE